MDFPRNGYSRSDGKGPFAPNPTAPGKLESRACAPTCTRGHSVAHWCTVTPSLWGSACVTRSGKSALQMPEMMILAIGPHSHPGIMVHSTETVTRKESVLKQMISLSLNFKQILRTCFEIINFIFYVSFWSIFPLSSVTMLWHCAFFKRKSILKNLQWQIL